MTYIDPAIILDLDGTLADVRGARHYVKEKPRNFDAFHGYASKLAPVNQAAKEIAVVAWNAGWNVIILSGRHEKWIYDTEGWLEKHNIRYDSLYLRPDDDFSKDVELKTRFYESFIKDDYDVKLAIDDNPSIVALWRSLGIPTLVVPGWDDDDDAIFKLDNLDSAG